MSLCQVAISLILLRRRLRVANFYEKALFVKADLAASSRPSAAAGPFALCFYSHSRGAHTLLVARCIG